MKKAATLFLMLVVAAIGIARSQDHDNPSKKPVRLRPAERARLVELRKELTDRVNTIARFVARDLGSPDSPPPRTFTVTVDNSGAAPTIHIEMEDILVAGDGNGCAKDPPGISCECPCP
jgi:hypothetical protein